jgi:fatty acid desaturase
MTPIDDYSGSFEKIRARLTDSRGVALVEFLRTLRPNYVRVYFDIALGYAALACTVTLLCLAERSGVPLVAIVFFGALLVGYWGLFLIGFIHEATHWNLAPTRKMNDWISNAFLGWLNGMEIKFYRRVHFEHHRSLGTPNDTEYSYFFPLNIMFLLRTVSGLRTLETILSYRMRQKTITSSSKNKLASASNMRAFYILFASALVAHACIIFGLWFFGFGAASLSWILGVGSVMPTLAAVRQQLEHRSEHTGPSPDYFVVEHGAVSRLFGDGPLASTFGSAGFNRHLLHHWEPQISYTRLADLERFLAQTPMRTVLDQRQSTYAEAFRRLFSRY